MEDVDGIIVLYAYVEWDCEAALGVIQDSGDD